jgi:uncharacterized FlgJ-related protein
MKQLPESWRIHIRKMTEHAQKSNQMVKELEDYLIKKGYTHEAYDETEGSEFQDLIIDTVQRNYDWDALIMAIEAVMNGADLGEISELVRD